MCFTSEITFEQLNYYRTVTAAFSVSSVNIEMKK